MKLPECRRYCRHTKMKTQNWHSANQLHVLHFILHPQNEVWPFEILCSVLKCLLLLFQGSFLQWSGRLWTWSTRFTLQLKSAFSRSCGEEGARPLRWPQLWSRSIWSSINALASGIKEGGCKFLWAASRTGSAGPGNHFENEDSRTSHNENWHSHNFFFCFWVFVKSWDIQVSKSDSRLFDDFFDGFHVSTPAGSAHRYGPKDRTSPDRSDRAERSARMRKALEKTAAAGAWSGPRLEKFVRQTPGTMELRQVGVFRFRIGRWRFVKFRYLDRAFTRQELLTQESREASTTSTHAVNEASSCSRWIHLVDFEIVYGWPKSSLERRRHAGLLSLAAPDLSADAGTT